MIVLRGLNWATSVPEMIFDLVVPKTTHTVNTLTGKVLSRVWVCAASTQTDLFSLFPCSVYCVDLSVARSPPPHTHTLTHTHTCLPWQFPFQFLCSLWRHNGKQQQSVPILLYINNARSMLLLLFSLSLSLQEEAFVRTDLQLLFCSVHWRWQRG